MTASALASLTRSVCLPARAAGMSVADLIAREGPASLGLQPALPPLSGWTSLSAPHVAVREEQEGCVVETVLDARRAEAALPPLRQALTWFGEEAFLRGPGAYAYCADARAVAVLLRVPSEDGEQLAVLTGKARARCPTGSR